MLRDIDFLADEIVADLERQKEAAQKKGEHPRTDFRAAARRVYNSHRRVMTSEELSDIGKLLAERKRLRAAKEKECEEMLADFAKERRDKDLQRHLETAHQLDCPVN